MPAVAMWRSASASPALTGVRSVSKCIIPRTEPHGSIADALQRRGKAATRQSGAADAEIQPLTQQLTTINHNNVCSAAPALPGIRHYFQPILLPESPQPHYISRRLQPQVKW